MEGGYAAQDFSIHVDFARELLSGKAPWDLKPVTNPPLLYILGAISMKGFGEQYGIVIVAVLFATVNSVSLYLLWRLCRPLWSQVWGILVCCLYRDPAGIRDR